MSPIKQRGSRVIYVAASAREFPPPVQDWLGQADNRAASSPDVYDALATLARGARPAAMIVSMDSVDWSEMEFFDHTARIGRDTTVYVTGGPHQAAKLQAACGRGAQIFDPQLADGALLSVDWKSAGPGGLLAGSLRPGGVVPPPEKPPPAPCIVVSPQAPGLEPEPPPERPVVRLVAPTEQDEPESPVPFPWAPAQNRPQRTPPRTAPPAPPAAGPEQRPSARVSPPVKLTQAELDALLGRPDIGDKHEEPRS